jgi:hypothetical protein
VPDFGGIDDSAALVIRAAVIEFDAQQMQGIVESLQPQQHVQVDEVHLLPNGSCDDCKYRAT